MSAAKIHLSQEEFEMVCSPGLILTKNAIIQKIKEFLEEVQVKQKKIIENYSGSFPAEVLKISPKVSKGENYKGLPWLVLDYPRYFGQSDVFAIRTMFWWGNFFSVTFHLSGKFKKHFQKKTLDSFSMLAEQDFFFCAGDNEWQHHFEPSNYRPLKEVTASQFEDLLYNNSFLKIARKFSLDHLEKMEELVCKTCEVLVKMCS